MNCRIGSKSLFLIITIMCLCSVVECQKDEIKEGGVYDATYYVSEDELCYKQLILTFKDVVSDRSYYRAALLKDRKYYKIGLPSVYLDPKSHSQLHAGIRVTEDDQLPEGNYSLVLGRFSSDQLSLGNLWAPTSSIPVDGPDVYIPDYRLMCGPYVGCSFGRKYAHVSKLVSDASGASATIRVRYGNLCGGGDYVSQYQSASLAWVTVKRQDDNFNEYGMIWAQVGYGQKRYPELAFVTSAVFRFSYVEIAGRGNNNVKKYVEYIEPNQNWTINYECKLDKVNGLWSFRKNGELFFSDSVKSEQVWYDYYGERAEWATEIFNEEDDMMGTVDSACEFTECQARQSEGYFGNVVIGAGDVIEVSDNNRSQWEILLQSLNSFDVWDVQPR